MKEKVIEEVMIAPSLKEKRTIKDECKVGSAKFFNWLYHVIGNESKFESNGRIYRILDPLVVKDHQNLPTLKIKDESVGKIMELNPNEIVDLVGEDKFSLKRGI